MIKKIFMVSTFVVLVFLIIITPTFISREPALGSIPRVLIDNLKFTVLVDIHSAVEDYRYTNISIVVKGLDNTSYRPSPLVEEETYGLHLVIQKNDTRRFELNVTLFDRNHRGFDYNATVEIRAEVNGDYMHVRRSEADQPYVVGPGGIFRDTLTARSVS